MKEARTMISDWLNLLLLRLRSLFCRRRVETELDDELQFHLDWYAERLIARGLSTEDARLHALRGGVAQRKEECRDMCPAQPLETIVRDVRYGLRSFKSHHVFTLTAILSLTLGIGANTVIITLMHVI
jgi:macrolide transport system ATP-binding/permease protein